MRVFLAAVIFAVLFAPTAHAQYRDTNGSCSAEYTWDQCQQSSGDPNAKEPGGGGGCSTPYLCTNSFPRASSNIVWCRATQSYQQCELYSCISSPCSGTNCTLTTEVCLDCESYLSNSATPSQC